MSYIFIAFISGLFGVSAVNQLQSPSVIPIVALVFVVMAMFLWPTQPYTGQPRELLTSVPKPPELAGRWMLVPYPAFQQIEYMMRY